MIFIKNEKNNNNNKKQMRERKTIIVYPQYNSFILGAFMFERYNYYGELKRDVYHSNQQKKLILLNVPSPILEKPH